MKFFLFALLIAGALAAEEPPRDKRGLLLGSPSLLATPGLFAAPVAAPSLYAAHGVYAAPAYAPAYAHAPVIAHAPILRSPFIAPGLVGSPLLTPAIL